MRSTKLIFGLIGLLLPIAYCGGLFFYFLEVAGSTQDAGLTGLGPTLLGLGAVGLLFFIPLILKSLRDLREAFAALPRMTLPSVSGAGTTRPAADYPDAPPSSDDGKFDPDAALARYMARRAAETPAPLPAPAAGGSAQRPVFGRKIV